MRDDAGPATLRTDDGVDLDARWSGRPAPEMVAVLTHPHPRYGGDMDSLVPATLARVLPEHGIATVRFNFRGTGGSTGTHGGGVDEILDVQTAVTAAAERYPNIPVVGVGYSFGADVLLALDDEHDQFRPFDQAADVVADWPDTVCEPVAGADHFLAGAGARVADAVVAFLDRICA